jgi:hypothetical protein
MAEHAFCLRMGKYLQRVLGFWNVVNSVPSKEEAQISLRTDSYK